MVETLLGIVLIFISTNIDDILILTILFASNKSSKKEIVIGQFLGILILTVFSMLICSGLNIINSSFEGLLGIIPIYLGIKYIIDIKKENNEVTYNKNITVIKVSLITIANGGDNIGIYIPSFNLIAKSQWILVLIIFFILTTLWLLISYYISEIKIIQKIIKRFSNIIIPITFILIGFYIIIKSNILDYFM